MTLLRAENLTKTYHNPSDQLIAIQDICFTVDEGEFICLVGPSGCGKSTLLRLLAGLLRPDTGQVYLRDQPLNQPTIEVGFVFQTASLMPWRTVWDNVWLPLQVKGQSRGASQTRVDEVLALVGLSDFADSYPATLSGGMAQRVALARALVHQPTMLLLDEPFGALDALNRERLNLELVRIWREQATTVVMVTHDINEATFLADRVIVLTPRPGRIHREVAVSLPRPRTPDSRYQSEFTTVTRSIRQSILS